MKIGVIVAGIVGLAVSVYLVLDYGLSDVWNAVLSAGWEGFTAVIIAHVVAIALCALAWGILVSSAQSREFPAFFWARFLRDGVNNLLGLVPCAGEVAGARELRIAGVPAGVAGATTVIDVTTELLSQLVFTFFGLAVLIYVHPGVESVWWIGAGLVAAASILVGFVFAQKHGLFRVLESLPTRLGLVEQWGDGKDAAPVHSAIQQIYRERDRISAAIAIHVVAWLARSAEAVSALYFMNEPISVLNIIALEALVYALRTAAFVVPSAVGVQEGGYVLIGGLFGLGAEAALALSLLKRAREVTLGVPALIAWQVLETQRLWRGLERRADARKTDHLDAASFRAKS